VTSRPPPGFVLVRLDDLAALLAAQPAPGTPAAAPAPSAGPPAAPWEAFSSAVALITARTTAAGVPDADLMDGAAAVIRALVTIAAAVIRAAIGPAGTGRLLQDLGALAARERPGEANGGTP